jgi:hypothetical protein
MKWPSHRRRTAPARAAAARAAAALSAVGLAAALMLGGCGAGDSGSTASSGRDTGGGAVAPEDQPPAEKAPAGEPAQPGQAQGGQTDQAQGGQKDNAQGGAPTRFRTDQRAIVYTGAMTVRVPDVDRAAARASEIATGAGGFVGQDKRSIADSRSQATLQLRVPAGGFYAVVDELARLGKEESRGLSSEDVTEAVVDVDARIATQQASVNRTRALLAQAKSIAEIVSVESELTKREAELASLQARKRQLADLTTLSTITVTLLGPAAVEKPKEDDTGFVAGLKAGWRAFLASVQVLLTVVGALVPWVVALGLPIWAIVLLARRFGRRSPTPLGPPAATVAAPTTPPPPPAADPPPTAGSAPAGGQQR